MIAGAQRLDALLDGYAAVGPVPDVMVRDVTADSRSVQRGALFLAVRGLTTDGRQYISDAIDAGAAAIAFESDDGFSIETPVPSVAVEGLGEASGFIADRFFDHPSKELVVVAITGTNGKTTCAWIVAQALSSLGVRCGVVGTLGKGFVDDMTPGSLTTPDPVSLHRDIAALKEDGARGLAIEISSHALDQGRANGLQTSVAVFTNLTQDHLDYHGTMQRYGEAKARLFERDLDHAVVNTGDQFGRELAKNLEQRVDPAALWTFGADDARVKVKAHEADLTGLRISAEVDDREFNINSKLIGDINVENVVCALATLCALGFEASEAATALSTASAAPGRMEKFDGQGFPGVVVDYAHTPDALAKALDAARGHTDGRIWCVFGCGGDRDRAKRPLMGKAAEERADILVITDDNPRNEDSARIIEDIRQGIAVEPVVIPDRRAAIAYAVSNATSGDLVLIAGKGHETTQTVGGRVAEFSDRQVVEELLRQPREVAAS